MKPNYKKNEKNILLKIYKEMDFKSIIECEKPDFEIIPYNNKHFGVEISVLYMSETSARVVNDPRYLSEILSNKKYKHKNDKNILVVKDIILTSPQNKKQKLKGVVQQYESPQEYMSKISEIIDYKNIKYKTYNKKLNHINLIIKDKEKIFNDIEHSLFCHYILKDKLVEILKKTPYQEIFLITHLKDKEERYFRLKICMLLKDINIIKKYLIEKNINYNEDELSFLQYIISILKNINYKNIYLGKIDNNLEIVYSGYGLSFNKEIEKINIKTYDYKKLPKKIKCKIIKLDKEIIDEVQKYLKIYSYAVNMGFLVNKVAT